MIHPTKTIGDLGVLKAQLDLTTKGFIVSWPLSEHSPFDLVITSEEGSRTVQVKTRTIDKNGSVEVKFRSVWINRSGVQKRGINRRLVDLYCLYCPDTDVCYYFRSAPDSKSIKLRVRAPKNNQKQNVRFANDYREVP